MLDKLKSLVFGFDEYEKAKIDERFLQINVIINDLEIREIKDFEILETVIFKIKELLRVKSSNLNAIIKNPKKKLNKKQVFTIVEELDKIKYNFLKKAFLAIENEKDKYQEKSSFNEEFKIKEKENNYINTQKVEEEILDKLEVYKNENFMLSVSNGKIPYLFFNFYNDVDYVLVKNLTSIFFEIHGMAGTNVIVEGNSALIIPRNENDNLFSMPRVDVNVDEIYNLLSQNMNKQSSTQNTATKQKEFIEIGDESIKRVNTSHKEDDSLDALLNGVEKKDFSVMHHSNQKDDEIKFEKSDSIEIQKNNSKKVEPEIEIEREIKEKEIKVEEKQIEEVEQPIHKSINGIEIFRDQNIICYLNKYSKVSGELVIENVAGLKLKDLEDAKLTYMFMFAKALGGVLFEVKEAHGTNIVSDFEDSCIRIVPRYQDDNVGLNWNLTQVEDSALEKVKHLLLSSMNSALENSKKSQEEKVQEKQIESQEDNSRVKEKAKHILQSLRRIP